MAGFASTPGLAAMSQRAHQILAGRGTAQTVQGLQTLPGLAARAQIPTTFLGGRPSQLAPPANQNLYAALRQTPETFTASSMAASAAARMQLMQAIAQQQQQAAYMAAMYG